MAQLFHHDTFHLVCAKKIAIFLYLLLKCGHKLILCMLIVQLAFKLSTYIGLKIMAISLTFILVKCFLPQASLVKLIVDLGL